MKTKYFFIILLVVSISIITYLSIQPGLTSAFYFDDATTLAPLGIGGGIKSFTHWFHYVFSGTTGPLGRPYP